MDKIPPMFVRPGEEIPQTLAICNKCRKVVGRHGGRWGEECACGIEVLSLGYTDPPVGCEKKRWWEVFRSYNSDARYHAANLATHNWDVLLVDGRVFLFQTKYGGNNGHWISPDFTRTDATDGEQRKLYNADKSRRFRHG